MAAESLGLALPFCIAKPREIPENMCNSFPKAEKRQTQHQARRHMRTFGAIVGNISIFILIL